MKKTIATGIAALALILTACTTTAVSGNFCSTDGDCVDGQLCVNGECFDSRNETDQTPCTSDGDCSSGTVCAATGFCEALGSGTSCTVTADCPVTQYCNISIQSPICTPLQPGACREASQCAGLMCTATAGGVGRCVECLRGADCSSGTCNPDGTCGTGSGGVDAGVTDSGGLDSSGFDSTLPDSGGCYPACNSAAGESCVAGVCYGANGCPLNAHPDGAGCVCDTGFAPNASGTACVASSGGSDAGTTLDSGGGTGDCTPACYSGETCYMGTCYNAEGCPRNSHADGQYCTCDDGYVPNAAGTGCEIAGAGFLPAERAPRERRLRLRRGLPAQRRGHGLRTHWRRLRRGRAGQRRRRLLRAVRAVQQRHLRRLLPEPGSRLRQWRWNGQLPGQRPPRVRRLLLLRRGLHPGPRRHLLRARERRRWQ
ncbi:MAG: hypothetical protein ABIJ09_03415 [Pseudomonadota bacterium]